MSASEVSEELRLSPERFDDAELKLVPLEDEVGELSGEHWSR
jgi:hypothetical protein